ncbi:MAG: methyl-accepting chemotaxis protein, partial [Chitinivibrionales bacterium]|nr:methyl-accepting chemotaxis protein [Chitinivibrionales bacterium]MBD3358162.1 methyl-accepting chemotaxis protein [Chitinivibrionales bacterium]
MLKNLPLKVKLIGAFVLIGLAPLLVAALVAVNTASFSLKKAAFDQLRSVREIKHNQIAAYFSERVGDVSVLATNPTVVSALRDMRKAFEGDGGKVGGSRWHNAKQTYGPWLSEYKEKYGYYDLFLIHRDGDVVYTVAQESDLGQNIVSGSLRSSSLGKCFRKSVREVGFADFEPYAPSNGEPASFVGAPVHD